MARWGWLTIGLLLTWVGLVLAAPEAICPGGASPRSDIIWCAGFDELASCTTGYELACWQANSYTGLPNILAPYGFRIEAGGAVVGTGRVLSRPRPGGTGGGGNITVFPGAVRTSAMAFRFYQRYGRGFMTFNGAHGQGILTTSPTQACSSVMKFQGSQYWFFSYYPILCGVGSHNLIGNQPNLPVMRNNRWYLVELQGIMDTVWTPRIDITSTMSVIGSDQSINCASCDFVTSGILAGLHMRLSGFSNGVNNAENFVVSSVSTTKLIGACRIEGGLPCTFVDESAAAGRRIRSMEADDANGVYRLWIDEQLVTEYTDRNFGGVTNAMQFSHVDSPLQYFHALVPFWGHEISLDNLVVSGDGTYIGPATSENPRGTADLQSPYYNYTPQEAFLGHRPGADCNANQGYLGANFSVQWRNGGVLEQSITHGRFLDQCTRTISQLGNAASVPTGTIWQVTDASGSTCATGGGSTVVQCTSNGSSWVVTSATDAAMEVTLSSSGNGGGVYWTGRGQPETTYVFPQSGIHGYLYLPSSNNYGAITLLALSGLSSAVFSTSVNYVAMTISNGFWAVMQRVGTGTPSIIESTTPVTFDQWHQFEIMLWDDQTVSLMIDGERLLTRQALPNSVAWMFATMNGARIVVGVIDFIGTAPFTVYYDDMSVGTASFWSCDGWSPYSCPVAPSMPTGVQRQ